MPRPDPGEDDGNAGKTNDNDFQTPAAKDDRQRYKPGRIQPRDTQVIITPTQTMIAAEATGR